MKRLFFKKIKKILIIASVSCICTAFVNADVVHVVEKGETLYSISKKYNSTIQSICDLNKIDGTGIKVGQKLTIPVSGSVSDQKTSNPAATQTPVKTTEKSSVTSGSDIYTVKKGDTWYGIARNYSINVKELYALNNTDGSQALKAGAIIKVPGKSSENKLSTTETVTSAKTPVAPVIDTHNYSNKKGDSNLLWPVNKPEVTYVNGKVSGVALSAKKDESVNAIKSGTVMFSGTYRGFGNVVFIQSKTGHIYAYTGLGKVLVSKGEYIDFKSQIGTAGIDSYSSKSQINLMVFQNGLPIDPAKAPRG